METIVQREHGALVSFWKALFESGRNPLDADARKPNGQVANLYLNRLSYGISDSMAVRRFHDSIGWCAGRGASCSAGLVCRGAIYRSEAFMRIPVMDRVGTARNGKPINIHIEHTVEAKQFTDSVWPHRPAGTAGALLFLMGLIPATALTYEERRRFGTSKKNPCFEPGAAYDRPFMRYAELQQKGTTVWNVLTREKIPLATYSFDQHIIALSDLLEQTVAPEFVKQTFRDAHRPGFLSRMLPQ